MSVVGQSHRIAYLLLDISVCVICIHVSCFTLFSTYFTFAFFFHFRICANDGRETVDVTGLLIGCKLLKKSHEIIMNMQSGDSS